MAESEPEEKCENCQGEGESELKCKECECTEEKQLETDDNCDCSQLVQLDSLESFDIITVDEDHADDASEAQYHEELLSESQQLEDEGEQKTQHVRKKRFIIDVPANYPVDCNGDEVQLFE